jgi:hypothetical protein
VLLGLGLAVPVFRVHIHIQNKTVVIQSKPHVLKGLPVNACLGIPQTAGVVPDGDAQSIQPSVVSSPNSYCGPEVSVDQYCPQKDHFSPKRQRKSIDPVMS